MQSWLTATLTTLLLAGVVSASPQARTEPGIRCTLTKKTVQTCCCEKRGDKLYCTLAKKTIDKCCCRPQQTPKEKTS